MAGKRRKERERKKKREREENDQVKVNTVKLLSSLKQYKLFYNFN